MGLYSTEIKYEINHIVFPVRESKDTILVNAKKAYDELQSGKSFEYISETYDVSEDTKNNSGYLGRQLFDELPDIIQSNIREMDNREIKLISSQSNAIHIIQLLDASSPGDKTFEDVRESIRTEISNERVPKSISQYWIQLKRSFMQTILH